MSELEALLTKVEEAGPIDRIDFRDPVAAYGLEAIPALEAWLADPRLEVFAVRTLEKIAEQDVAREDVIDVFESLEPSEVSAWVVTDVRRALAKLSTRPATPASAEWPQGRTVSDLERAFHSDMLDIFRLAGEATRHVRPDGSVERGYWASYFLRAVRKHGGLEYARQLLNRTGTTPGFERLTNEGRLDLTMEALVLKPRYAPLFTERERKEASSRLARAGYSPRP
jgi:hypothetical protein